MASLRVRWKDYDFFTRYFSFIFPLLLFAGLIVEALKTHDILTLAQGALLLVIIFLPIVYVYWIDGRLRAVPFPKPSKDLREKLAELLTADGWDIRRNNINFITVHRNARFSAGSKAAILFKDNRAYFNVQNRRGMRGYVPFSFGANKRKTRKLIEMLNSFNSQGV